MPAGSLSRYLPPSPVEIVDDVRRGSRFWGDAVNDGLRKAWQNINSPLGRTVATGAAIAGGAAATTAMLNNGNQTPEQKADNLHEDYMNALDKLNKEYQAKAQIQGIGDPTKAMERQFESDVRQESVLQDLTLSGLKKQADLNFENEVRNQPLYSLARSRDRLGVMGDRINNAFATMASAAQYYR